MRILIGEDAEKIAAALTGLLPIKYASDMEAAIKLAGEIAQKNNIVLFSPACASFDMYQNFEKRGEDFVRCTNAWLAERGAA